MWIVESFDHILPTAMVHLKQTPEVEVGTFGQWLNVIVVLGLRGLATILESTSDRAASARSVLSIKG